MVGTDGLAAFFVGVPKQEEPTSPANGEWTRRRWYSSDGLKRRQQEGMRYGCTQQHGTPGNKMSMRSQTQDLVDARRPQQATL